MHKKTIFFVIDTETSGFNGSVHDFAWIATDRSGEEYSRGSYFFPEVFTDPSKLAKKEKEYAELFATNRVTKASWDDVRSQFNNEIERFKKEGHRVIIAAYNAKFDYDKLDLTEFNLHPEKYTIEHGVLKGMPDSSLASYVIEYSVTSGYLAKFTPSKIEWMDIWMQWAMSCPRSYTSEKRTSKGWMQTTAQDVGRFEIDPDYVQHHYAIADCEGEKEILLKALNRKKKLAINTIFDTFPPEIAHHRVIRADKVAA